MLRKFIIGGVILFLAWGFLFYKGFKNYYYTVSELVSQGNPTRNVRVRGVVAPGTLKQGSDVLSVNFMLTDGEESLPVIYYGVLPQTFQEGKEVVVEGKYNLYGMFKANRILTTCHL